MTKPEEPTPTRLKIEEAGDHAVLRPSGYVNASIGDEINRACRELLERDVRYFIVNFAEVAIVNSIAISSLLELVSAAQNRDGRVYFTEVGPTERDTFEVLQLSTQSVAHIFETDEDARCHAEQDRKAVRRKKKE